MKSIGIPSVVQYRICHGVTFGLLTILLRFWTNIFPCWLDVMYQPRLSVWVTTIGLGLMINAGMLLASFVRLIFGENMIALWLTGKSSSTLMPELMKPAPRIIVRLVTETGMFLWTFSLLISAGPLLSLQCSARVCHCLFSLVRVMDWCMSRLVRLIWCRIILIIPKGPPSSSVVNYRPIPITSVSSKVFESLVSVRLGRFMERSGLLPTTQFAYPKGLGFKESKLKSNTWLTRFFNPTKTKSVRWPHCQLGIGGPTVLCLTISRNDFVSRSIWLKIIVNLEWIGTCGFCHFPIKTEMCRVWVLILTLKYAVCGAMVYV